MGTHGGIAGSFCNDTRRARRCHGRAGVRLFQSRQNRLIHKPGAGLNNSGPAPPLCVEVVNAVSHAGFRGFFRAIVLCRVFTAQAAAAETQSLPFPQGFVGTRGSNNGQANDIQNFATLGISKAHFI